MKASEIKTLSQLAEYINKEDGWFLETVNIIANNGWKDETNKKWTICSDGRQKVEFNEQMEAKVIDL